jgi:Response regulator containing CheY-like receiver domain and AraC-type DNA-binding domain
MLTIILADDEVEFRDIMVNLIPWNKHGLEMVGVADNGESAYHLIQEKRPDIVLLDIHMPVMSGLEVIRKIREENRIFPAFIIISGYSDFEYAQEAVRLAAVDYLLKPFKPQELIEAIEKHKNRSSILNRLSTATGAAGLPEPLPSLLQRSDEADFQSLNYPAQQEQAIMHFLKAGMVEEVDEALQNFWRQVEATNIGQGQMIGCMLMLYSEIVRFLADRGAVLPLTHFGNIVWQNLDSVALLTALRNMVAEAFSAVSTNRESHRYVSNATRYIDAHFRENLTLDSVAQQINLSPTYLSSLFTRFLHMSFVEYVQSVRVEKAKQYLLSSTYKIYEIAELVGYSDHKYFSQVFKKTEKISPSQFRDQSNVDIFSESL